MDRSKRIVRTSLAGIAVNLVLAVFKAVVGLAAHSIAVVLDAVNNLSDVLSSVITIVGTRLAGKRPDREHPFGHGRIEYLTSVLIAVIVLLAGVLALKESVEKILQPESAHYTVLSLAIIAVAVAAKLVTGTCVRRVGRAVNSGALIASGTDALFDAVLSFATLIGGAVCLLWGVSLEGWLGVLISAAILKAGVEILGESVSSIIGTRADPELTQRLRARIASFDEVRGVYDLALHNYGPTQTVGAVHIEVADDMPAREIHRLTRAIASAVREDFGITLTVGVYASDEDSAYLSGIRRTVEELISAEPAVLQLHGFYGDEARHQVMFDLVVDFQADAAAVRTRLLGALQEKYPNERFDVIIDSDCSD